MDNDNKLCAHCKTNPGPRPGNTVLWNGFYDKDTEQLCCWNCQEEHYKKKSLTEHAGKWTEFPVYLIGRI